jgi:hypothetical protein
MKKISPRSIVFNPTDLQSGATTESLADRSATIQSQGTVSWDGSNIVAPNVDIVVQDTTDTYFTVARLPAGTYTLNNHQLLVVCFPRNNYGPIPTTLTQSIYYPNLNPGEYAIINEGQLGPMMLSKKDWIILFKRKDLDSGIQELFVPLIKQALLPGTTTYLGASPLPPATIQYVDSADTVLPTGSSVTIDGNVGVNGDKILFTNLLSNNNRVYVLSGVGSSITWTPSSQFTTGIVPANGDQVKVLKGLAYADQFGIYNGTSWSFSNITRSFNSAGDYFEQASIRNVAIADGATANIFTITALGSENLVIDFSIIRGSLKETGQLIITQNGSSVALETSGAAIADTGVSFSASLSGGNLLLNYTASSIGQSGTMKYTVKRWADLPGGPAGIPDYSAVLTIPTGYLNVAYTTSDGSAINVNCLTPYLVSGKTRMQFQNFVYTMSVNPGTTGGDLEVIADGAVIPRYLPGVTTSAYYKEIDNQTIEFWGNLNSPAISLEVRRKQGTVDTSVGNAAKIAAMYDLVVGSSAQVLQGIANYSSINSAISNALPGSSILILAGTYTENVLINKQVVLVGKGYTTVINGTLEFNSSSLRSLVEKLKVVGNITFDTGSTGNYVEKCWQGSSGTVISLGTDNIFQVIGD